MNIKINTYGVKGSARTTREAEISAREFHTAFHRAIMDLWKDPVMKKKKRHINQITVTVSK